MQISQTTPKSLLSLTRERIEVRVPIACYLLVSGI
jgi:hypothetical protein